MGETSMGMYALILAGGSGTRLWPYSRTGKPKQFLAMGPDLDGSDHRSMLQETVDRILPIIPPERIFVVTGSMYVDMVAEHLPNVPDENIIVEPTGKGTAPCIGLGAMHILHRDPDAVMAVLSSDHSIKHAETLREVLLVGERIARQGHLVTIGIQPNTPATGYGYIQKGEPLPAQDGVGPDGANPGDHAGPGRDTHPAYKVKAFVEKPDAEHARAYVESGDYLWNAGMFVWRADRIMEELKAHCPGVAQPLSLLDGTIGTPDEQSSMLRAWRDIENIAIDVAVMERTAHAAVIPTDLAWSDVGDWAALADILPQDDAGNAVVGKFVGLDTRRSFVYSNNRVIATIGVEDMLIVDTHDVLLICPRRRAQDVKTMVAQLKTQNMNLV
ncbi:MAG: sugar phosphate nucleotidyltransferase [Chloroflexi bacterium]|nr:sugar phosphate nucleotidyltransferase [Chloroflexota bacterium]